MKNSTVLRLRVKPLYRTGLMIVELETKRLLLRPLQLADAEETERLFPKWEVVKFLNAEVSWPYPANQVFPRYRDVILPAMERGEEWHWSLRLKESPEHLIGKISLHQGEWDNRGYWLGLPWQAQGLMTEAVAAVNDYWVRCSWFQCFAGSKGRCQCRLKADLGEDGYACDCHSRTRLRVRSTPG